MAKTSFSRLAGTVTRWAGLVFLMLMVCPACSTDYSSVGEPIDLEAMREFKSFELNEFPSGETRRLADFLDQVTLVSFFFPT